jgi:cation diffusion facilitator CzcD-associated flavoprotein CzcO
VADGFVIRLDDGETFRARRVVLAVGITHFEYVPENLSQLTPDYLSHSSRHSDLGRFRGRRVIVLGGGSSAMDAAGLLHDAGANVQMVCRRPELKFPPRPTGKPRSLWQQLRHPPSGLGNGIRRRFLSNSPSAFIICQNACGSIPSLARWAPRVGGFRKIWS